MTKAGLRAGILIAALLMVGCDQHQSGSSATRAFQDGETATRQIGDAFNRFDRDGNGRITRDEAAVNPRIMDRWSRLDANADGKLNPAEFAARNAKPSG